MHRNGKELQSICESFMKNTMDFYDIPGISAGVYCSGFHWTAAAGCRNYKSGAPVMKDTVFHCTSVSKLFTACGIMKLVEEGRLTLSNRAEEILPYLSIADKRWKDMTIKSMMTHTSGLSDVADYGWQKHRTADNVLKEYVLSEEVSGRRLLWSPHENKFRYSNVGYDLLGLVIAEISGMTFEEFMKKEIFEPLCMNDTTFLTADRFSQMVGRETDSDECENSIDCELFLAAADEAGLAMPHRKNRDRSISPVEVYPYTRQHAPSSTITSTTGDMMKWAGNLIETYSNWRRQRDVELRRKGEEGDLGKTYGDVLLRGESIDMMWTIRNDIPGASEKMALGWFAKELHVKAAKYDDDEKSFFVVGHEGSDEGFRTSLWICPRMEAAVVLMCNMTDAPLGRLSSEILKALVRWEAR